jgi:aconitate hydratase
MGVLPCQFKGSDSVASLGITGEETFDITGIETLVEPQIDVTLTIHRKDGTAKSVPLLLRIDTPIEVDYYRHGGILPFVLRELVSKAA